MNNLACRSRIPVFLDGGLLQTSVLPHGSSKSVALHVGLTRIRRLRRHVSSIRSAQSRRQRPAAVATDSESSVGQLEKENGTLFGRRGQSFVTVEAPRRGIAEDLEPGRTQIRSVHDYMEQVTVFLTDDGGPPRWFSPLLPPPPINAPLLLFLPGMDGTGLGLIIHHESLGRLFEMRCLHIPAHDRTAFTGLLRLVEETVLAERERRPSSPIYLMGDSFGGALALSIAARNPKLDLILVLANPGESATSFDRSQLQPLFPLVYALPSDVYSSVPYLLSFILGDPLRMAEAKVQRNASPLERAEQLRSSLLSLLPTLSILADVMPKETLLWKLKTLHAAALYTNSRLHAIRAEVLVLASGKDQMLPSKDEAERLKKIIPGCRVRYFKDSGHTLLLEGNLNLATVIKAAGVYRRSKHYDSVADYVRPTKEELELFDESACKVMRQLTSPVYFSTSEDGQVVQGLSNIPTDRPILLVGNHMFLGLDLSMFIAEFLKEKSVLIRGLAHPILVGVEYEASLQEASMGDLARLFGAVRVTGRSMFKLLKNGDSVLLYPGGAREALHRKGEVYKLFWPEQSEFVRMAARYGYTIIPFSIVGEDDLLDILVDFDDIRSIPFLKDRLVPEKAPQLRANLTGDVSDQVLHLPIAAPKVPGRLYGICGKPIHTEGRREELQDKRNADVLYQHVKSEVESGLLYLQEKRKEDSYREFVPRLLYESSWGSQAPTFKP